MPPEEEKTEEEETKKLTIDDALESMCKAIEATAATDRAAHLADVRRYCNQ